MCENKEKRRILKFSRRELEEIFIQYVFACLVKLNEDIVPYSDIDNKNVIAHELKIIHDINGIIDAISYFEKHNSKVVRSLKKVHQLDDNDLKPFRLEKLTEIKSNFISINERKKEKLTEIIESIDKDLALTSLEKMKNLYASSNNHMWPCKEKVEAKLGINYANFMKNEVGNFLYELDKIGELDNFIRLLCACIFQEESDALRYASAFKSPPIKFMNLINGINSNMQSASASFDPQWPSKSDVEKTLNTTYGEYCLAVEKILKEKNNIRKSNLIHFLIACIFHDEKQANDSFLIVSLSGLELMKEFGKKLEEKAKEFEKIVKNKKTR